MIRRAAFAVPFALTLGRLRFRQPTGRIGPGVGDPGFYHCRFHGDCHGTATEACRVALVFGSPPPAFQHRQNRPSHRGGCRRRTMVGLRRSVLDLVAGRWGAPDRLRNHRRAPSDSLHRHGLYSTRIAASGGRLPLVGRSGGAVSTSCRKLASRCRLSGPPPPASSLCSSATSPRTGGRPGWRVADAGYRIPDTGGFAWVRPIRTRSTQTSARYPTRLNRKRHGLRGPVHRR